MPKIRITNTSADAITVEFSGESFVLDKDTVAIFNDPDTRKDSMTISGFTTNTGEFKSFNFLLADVALPVSPASKAALIATVNGYVFNVTRWVKVTKTFSDFTAGSTGVSITGYALPAGGVVHAVKLKHSAAFTGGSVSACTVSVGIAGTVAKYLAAQNVFQAPGDLVQGIGATIGAEGNAAATNILLTAASTGGNLSTLTAGSVDVWLLVSVCV